MADHSIYFADCDTCHGPVRHKTRFELIRDWLAYEIWMAIPTSLGMTKPGLWLLSHAGGHAYTCTYPEKVLRAQGGGS
jgi:hypothetical protein